MTHLLARFAQRLGVLSLTALLAVPASAQDEATPTFIVTAHQCDARGLDALVDHHRERGLPILQALVDEGGLLAAGTAVHHWGDEYSLLTWQAGPDLPSTLEGWEQAGARYEEAHPDDRLFIETCPKHRDTFYTRRAWTAADEPPPVGEGNTPTLAISYYTCAYPEMSGIVEEYVARSQPIAQALVDEGLMNSEGLYTHDWGDEWNLVITRSAPDLPALLTALSTFGERFEAEQGEDAQSLVEEHCSAHKDNIYTVVMATN